MKRTMASVLFSLAIAACGKSEPTADKPASPKPVESKPADKPKNPDFTVTARDLYSEFRPQIEAGTADPVRAKYTGKTVRISGVVATNADLAGTWELSLVANDATGRAFLHPSKESLADVKALKPNDNVTLQCVSEGWEIGPQFKDCSVVK